MKRRLFTILSALSLLLCVAAVVLWVRSYYFGDHIRFQRPSDPERELRFLIIGSGRGTVGVGRHDLRLVKPWPQYSSGYTLTIKDAYTASFFRTSSDRPLVLRYAPTSEVRRLWREPRAAARITDGFGQAAPKSSFGFVHDSHGFRLEPDRDVRSDAWFVGVPYWVVTLIIVGCSCLMIRSTILRLRRHRAGLCPSCGYDLRATPDRCPECGTEAAKGKP